MTTTTSDTTPDTRLIPEVEPPKVAPVNLDARELRWYDGQHGELDHRRRRPKRQPSEVALRCSCSLGGLTSRIVEYSHAGVFLEVASGIAGVTEQDGRVDMA
jgi:hypothetical protein